MHVEIFIHLETSINVYWVFKNVNKNLEQIIQLIIINNN